MQIIVTGSLGHISQSLTLQLLQKGHSVTVISSNRTKQTAIEAMGATAAIGSLADIEFLTKTFKAADAAYCMIPPNFSAPDQLAYYQSLGDAYAAAIRESGIKRIVHLSSYGAELESGTGFITGSNRVEKMLNGINGIALTHIRPTSFYYNLLGFIEMIKHAGFIGSVYGGEDRLPMVAPSDIAMAIATELPKTENHRDICYVCSDDRTCNDIAQVLGAAIGLPGLQWKTLPADAVLKALLQNGISSNAATNLVELGLAIHTGLLRREFDQQVHTFGKVKLENFAKEFAAAYGK